MSTPSSSAGDARSIQDRFAQIRLGMDVEDVAGEHVGKVADLRVGDPDAIDVGEPDPLALSGEGFALAMGAHREPNVAPGLVGRLLQAGYIKIDDKRHFRRDHHYYALTDEIASVEADKVRLGKPYSELITSLD